MSEWRERGEYGSFDSGCWAVVNMRGVEDL